MFFTYTCIFVGNYISCSIEELYKRSFKQNDIVVFAQEEGIPQFGQILQQEADGAYKICKLQTIHFARNLHCYKVAQTGQSLICRAPDFLLFDSMRLYHGSYVRLPYALFCKLFSVTFLLLLLFLIAAVIINLCILIIFYYFYHSHFFEFPAFFSFPRSAYFLTVLNVVTRSQAAAVLFLTETHYFFFLFKSSRIFFSHSLFLPL